jgi:Universal stress protein family
MDHENDMLTVLRVADPDTLEEYAGRHPWRVYSPKPKTKAEARSEKEKPTESTKEKKARAEEDRIPWRRTDVQKRVSDAGVRNSSNVLIASYRPGRGIVGFVRRHRYDFLVMGVVGSTWERFKRFMGDGSVSAYCKQYAPSYCTVVVVEQEKVKATSSVAADQVSPTEGQEVGERYSLLRTQTTRNGTSSDLSLLEVGEKHADDQLKEVTRLEKVDEEAEDSRVVEVLRAFRSLFSTGKPRRTSERALLDNHGSASAGEDVSSASMTATDLSVAEPHGE